MPVTKPLPPYAIISYGPASIARAISTIYPPRSSELYWIIPPTMTRPQRHRVQPGSARLNHVFRPIREKLVSTDTYRPCNRVKGGSAGPMLTRPLDLARRLPWLPKFNFARS